MAKKVKNADETFDLLIKSTLTVTPTLDDRNNENADNNSDIVADLGSVPADAITSPAA